MGRRSCREKGNRVRYRKTEGEAGRIYRVSERKGARNRERRGRCTQSQKQTNIEKNTTRDRKKSRQTGSERERKTNRGTVK